MAKTPLQELADHGQSVWIDYLSRPFVHDGDLAGLVDQGVKGVTSNPTIFQGAIAEGDAYDDQIRELVGSGQSDPKEIFVALASDDIRDACDVLRRVYDDGGGKDGYVSFEVDPRLAHDTQATIDEAKRLHGLIERRPGSHRYEVTGRGLRIALFFTRSYARLLRPGLTELSEKASPADAQLRRAAEQLEAAMDRYVAQAKLTG